MPCKEYGGTIAQWEENVEKGDGWNQGIPVNIVRCTDGVHLPVGAVVEGYRVKSMLSADAETEKYICEKYGEDCILTYYVSRTPDVEALDKIRSLKNPHLLKLYKSGTYGDKAFSITEYIQNGSLSAENRPLGEKSAKNVITQVLDGLKALHEAGLVHGGIRPENLLTHTSHMKKANGYSIYSKRS